LLAAADPANPWGATLRWPDSAAHRPTRSPGAVVVLDDGAPVCYLERGAHTLLTFAATTPDRLARALGLIGEAVDAERLPTLTLRRIDDGAALESPLSPVLTAAGFRMVPQGFRRRPTG